MPLNTKDWLTSAHSNLWRFLTHDIHDLVFRPDEVGGVFSFIKLLNERICLKISEVLKISALSKNTLVTFDFGLGRAQRLVDQLICQHVSENDGRASAVAVHTDRKERIKRLTSRNFNALSRLPLEALNQLNLQSIRVLMHSALKEPRVSAVER